MLLDFIEALFECNSFVFCFSQMEECNAIKFHSDFVENVPQGTVN